MWIVTLTVAIGGLLIFIFADCKKISKEFQGWLSYIVYAIVITVMIAVILQHSDFITPIVESYQCGKIVKHETITIEGTDTIKVVKYKYK